MRKLLILAIALVLVLGLSTLTLAQENSVQKSSWSVDLGLSLMNSQLTPRLDMDYGYVQLPLNQELNELSVGVKTPPLLFDIYGLGGFSFQRIGGDFFAGWELATNQYLRFGVGKSISFDNLLVRLEWTVRINQDAGTDYGPQFILQYKFGGD